MLKNDNEETARESAAMFDDPRVTQFYDPERLVGYMYHFDVFPNASDEMAGSLPEDHSFRESIVARADRRRDSPEWDIYMWYEKGIKWDKDAPRPSRFIRQVANWDEDGEMVSLMWIDDLKQAPVVSSLHEHVSGIMHAFIPHD